MAEVRVAHVADKLGIRVLWLVRAALEDVFLESREDGLELVPRGPLIVSHEIFSWGPSIKLATINDEGDSFRGDAGGLHD